MERSCTGKVKLINKMKSFWTVVQTPKDVKPVGYKRIFVRKLDENNDIIRYKMRLVAQDFL